MSKPKSRGRPERAVNGGNDSYYSLPKTARSCARDLLEWLPFTPALMVEPSAGAGDFVRAASRVFPADTKIRAYDVLPGEGSTRVRRKDWLTTTKRLPKNTCVFGNPPWGFASSSAVKFFNHAAGLNATTIAFILPLTFRKSSVQRRLDKRFALVFDRRLSDDAFYVPGEGPVSVPSCFQIWLRLPKGKTRRDPQVKRASDLFYFVPPTEPWDFTVRRVGSRAGKLLDPAVDSLTPSTTLFLRAAAGQRDELHRLLRRCDFTAVRDNTAGVRSVSKAELVQEVDRLAAKSSASTRRARLAARPQPVVQITRSHDVRSPRKRGTC